MGVDGLEDFKTRQRFIFHPLYTLAESVVNYWASARDRRKREKIAMNFRPAITDTINGKKLVVVCSLLEDLEIFLDPIGMARISFFVPDPPSDEKPKQQLFPDETRRTLEMDALFLNNLSNGWNDYFIGTDDIAPEDLEGVDMTRESLIEITNKYFAEKGFGLCVR